VGSPSEDELVNFLGKELRDIYGRQIGNIVALTMGSDDSIESIQVQRRDGTLARFPVGQMVLDERSPILLPEWKVESEEVARELQTARKRSQALRELLCDEEISSEVYSELTKQQDDLSKQVNERRGRFLDKLQAKSKQLDEQIRQLSRFLVDVKMEHRAGEIDQGALDVACRAVEPIIKTVTAEKKELEKARALAANEVGQQSSLDRVPLRAHVQE